jgi:hypothetical protein
MKISKIYEKYKIMPQLQLHQLRVAGVASVICDNFQKPIDKSSIISACLLHDMGNIVKFKLDLYPENLEPQGIDYWENVKNKYIKKYGKDDHIATNKITNELNINKNIQDIILSYGFAQATKTYKTTHLEYKIAVYSDMRVAPERVVSLNVRLAEGKKRYAEKINAKYTPEEFEFNASLWKKIEKQIFSQCKIKPNDITEEKVQPLIEKLRNLKIKTG